MPNIDIEKFVYINDVELGDRYEFKEPKDFIVRLNKPYTFNPDIYEEFVKNISQWYVFNCEGQKEENTFIEF